MWLFQTISILLQPQQVSLRYERNIYLPKGLPTYLYILRLNRPAENGFRVLYADPGVITVLLQSKISLVKHKRALARQWPFGRHFNHYYRLPYLKVD